MNFFPKCLYYYICPYEQGLLADDPVFATRSMPVNLASDLLMLENQLPLFVLQRLFDLTSSGQQDETCLHSLALQFFEPLRPGKDEIPIELLSESSSDTTSKTESRPYPHLLALFQSSFALKPNKHRHHPPPPPPSPVHQQRSKNNGYRTFVVRGWIHNAKYLLDAGVRFTNDSSGSNVLNIEFRRLSIFISVLKIPTLFMNETTTSIFRNLVAYEQLDRSVTPQFTSLAVFYNNILGSPNDVAVLKQSGILRGGNGSDEIVSFFDSLTKDLVFHMDSNCFKELFADINSLYQTPRVRFFKFLRSRFFL